jgi:hypothetical protein
MAGLLCFSVMQEDKRILACAYSQDDNRNKFNIHEIFINFFNSGGELCASLKDFTLLFIYSEFPLWTN